MFNEHTIRRKIKQLMIINSKINRNLSESNRYYQNGLPHSHLKNHNTLLR